MPRHLPRDTPQPISSSRKALPVCLRTTLPRDLHIEYRTCIALAAFGGTTQHPTHCLRPIYRAYDPYRLPDIAITYLRSRLYLLLPTPTCTPPFLRLPGALPALSRATRDASRIFLDTCACARTPPRRAHVTCRHSSPADSRLCAAIPPLYPNTYRQGRTRTVRCGAPVDLPETPDGMRTAIRRTRHTYHISATSHADFALRDSFTYKPAYLCRP